MSEATWLCTCGRTCSAAFLDCAACGKARTGSEELVEVLERMKQRTAAAVKEALKRDEY